MGERGATGGVFTSAFGGLSFAEDEFFFFLLLSGENMLTKNDFTESKKSSSC